MKLAAPSPLATTSNTSTDVVVSAPAAGRHKDEQPHEPAYIERAHLETLCVREGQDRGEDEIEDTGKDGGGGGGGASTDLADVRSSRVSNRSADGYHRPPVLSLHSAGEPAGTEDENEDEDDEIVTRLLATPYPLKTRQLQLGQTSPPSQSEEEERLDEQRGRKVGGPQLMPYPMKTPPRISGADQGGEGGGVGGVDVNGLSACERRLHLLRRETLQEETALNKRQRLESPETHQDGEGREREGETDRLGTRERVHARNKDTRREIVERMGGNRVDREELSEKGSRDRMSGRERTRVGDRKQARERAKDNNNRQDRTRYDEHEEESATSPHTSAHALRSFTQRSISTLTSTPTLTDLSDSPGKGTFSSLKKMMKQLVSSPSQRAGQPEVDGTTRERRREDVREREEERVMYYAQERQRQRDRERERESVRNDAQERERRNVITDRDRAQEMPRRGPHAAQETNTNAKGEKRGGGRR